MPTPPQPEPDATPLSLPVFASAAMRAITSDGARVGRMLDFCAALARAEAAIGIIPASAAGEIADACRVEHFDIAALSRAAAANGDLAGPLVATLTAAVAARSERAAEFVLHGAAHQDLIDTALVLELRAAIEALIADVARAIGGFTTLAGRHRRTVMAARTLLRQSGPLPFGLKLAGYAAALGRSRERLRRLQKESIVLQFGGSTGTLASFGEQGLDVADRLAAQLDLPVTDAPWHSQRDRLADVASVFSILATTCGKIGRDIALSMQTEIGEVLLPAPGGSEPDPAGDPRLPALALAAATAAPALAGAILSAQVQEHEAAAGRRYAEWAAFPALELATAGALAAIAEIATTMQPDTERMAENLERPGGLAMAETVTAALAAKIGRKEAEAIVGDLCRAALRNRKPLRELAEKDTRLREHFDAPALSRLFFPTGNLGSAQVFIDRLIGSTQGRTVRRIAPQPAPQPSPDTLAAKLKSVDSAASSLGALGSAGPQPGTSVPSAKPDETPQKSGQDSGQEPGKTVQLRQGALLEAFARAGTEADEQTAPPPPEHPGERPK